jgi:hypothetical protein
MSSSKILWLIGCAAAASAAPGLASQTPPLTDVSVVEEAPLVPDTIMVSVTEPAQIEANEGLMSLSDSELSTLRGGEALVISNQTLTAITTGNVITGNYSAGNVSLSDHALSSFNGVGNLLINTGGQVSLQSGMNLTINVGD